MRNPFNLVVALIVAISAEICVADSTNGSRNESTSASPRSGLQQVADKTAKEAWEVLRAGRIDDAKYQFNQALMLDSSNWSALWGLGIVYAQQGALDESRKSFEKAEPLLANDANFNVDYARTLGFLGVETRNERMIKRAFELFRKVYEVAPQHRVNLENWAVILFNIGNYAEAWEKIKLAEKTPSGRSTNPKFIAALESKMPRPR